MIAALLLMVAMPGIAQQFEYEKIAPDLLAEINASSKSGEMFQTIIVMNEQFDAQKSTRQTQQLNKTQQRAFVMNELQTISSKGQKEVLADLQQGQKVALVEDIRSFWIVNAIGCSMTKDMVFAIADRPDVKFVMKDTEIHIADGEVSKEIQLVRGENQWNVLKVNADDVWALGYTGAGIIVAVIDTGVNYNHTDIANNMWDGGSEYPNHGWDFINGDNDPMDDNGHGTHCAGTVSSYGTNGKQCGIAKDAKIMALKSLGSNGSGSSAYTIPAIEFAISHGADILNMSLGGNYGGFWPYRVALENVLHCGVIASVSAGNEGENLSTYPIPLNVGCPGNCPAPWRHPDQTLKGGHSAIVTVGATTSDDTHSNFSSQGPSTWAEGENIGFYDDYPWDSSDPTKIGLIKPDISAPGSGIVSLLYSSNDGYTSMNGTSMAAPCVAGVMALMLQANPTLTPVEIDSIIETKAVKIESQTSKNNTVGAGRIDVLEIINYMRNVCAAPTGLAATVNEANVTLNWAAAESVASYRIYRNGVMIAKTVSGTTFTDINAPAGNNIYFVRSNGDSYHASLPSNQVVVNVTTNAEFSAPSHLEATSINTTSGTLTLNWNAPVAHESILYHVNSGNHYAGDAASATLIAGQRFPSSMLQPYAGMQIEHIFFSLLNSGATCTINLYEGDQMRPGKSVFEGVFTTTEENQQVDYNLSTPIVINPNKDLWLTITTTDKILSDNSYSGEIGDAYMLKNASDPHWYSYAGSAWSFQLGLSTTGYSYNIYRNGIAVSSNQSETNYTGSYTDGMNTYRVTAVSNSYESFVSNTVMVVNNTASLSDLTVDSNDKLIVLPNTTLTITGTLSNDNPANLILEDGAQLIHSSSGVKATVKKSITPYTSSENGWHFIASPVTESITPSDGNGFLPDGSIYDLYYYEESAHHWRNYRANNFNLAYKQGYLYANNVSTTLQFAGTLTPSDNAVSISNLSHGATILNGFNLVGNPFACNATIDQDCYVISGRQVTKLAPTAKTFAPCEGAFIKATSDEYTVTFTKSGAKSNSNGACLDLVVTQGDNQSWKDGAPTGSTAFDRARVRLGKGIGMEKFDLNDGDDIRLTLWQNGQDFAVAYANGLDELPLNFKVAENGTYTLGIESNSLNLDYLHLIDNMTGADVDLLASPTYTFEAKATNYASRFRLVFSNKSICEDTDSDNAFAFISNGEIVINGASNDATLQIIDVTGRVVISTSIMSNVSTNGMPAGVYVLRLVTNNGVKTQKMIIE
jgi:subtilisin family serine protease